MVVTRTFSFSHNVFNSYRIQKAVFKLQFVVCKYFEIDVVISSLQRSTFSQW